MTQKNQLFLLEAFAAAKSARPDIALALVGDGADRNLIEERIVTLGLQSDVILTGYREDIPAVYSAFDLFALPSCFEGLGIVLIEAQASGLPCIASDAVPRETLVTGCRYLPLDDANIWAKEFVASQASTNRVFPAQAILDCGYDIKTEALKLQQAYFEAVKRK